MFVLVVIGLYKCNSFCRISWCNLFVECIIVLVVEVIKMNVGVDVVVGIKIVEGIKVIVEV